MMQTDFFSMQNLDNGSLSGFETEKAFGNHKAEQRLAEKSKSFLSTLNKLSAHQERSRLNRRTSETSRQKVQKPDPNSHNGHRLESDQNHRKSVTKQQPPSGDDHDDGARDVENISERQALWDLLMAVGLETIPTGQDPGLGSANVNGQGLSQLDLLGATDLENLIRQLQVGKENSAIDLTAGLQRLTQFITAIQNRVDGTGLLTEPDFNGRFNNLMPDFRAFNENSDNLDLKASILEKLQHILQQVNPTALNNLISGTDPAMAGNTAITVMQTSGIMGEGRGLNPDAVVTEASDLEKLASGLQQANPEVRESSNISTPAQFQSVESNSKSASSGSVDTANDSQGQKQSEFKSLNQGGNPKFSNHEAPSDNQNKHGLQVNGNPDASGPVTDSVGYNLAIEEANSKMGPKADVTFSNELDARMVSAEVSSKDNGIMAGQGQGADKTLESVSSTKEAESSQDTGRSPTLNQIVQKAAIYLKNGRHEVKIDLKPDYLGHVRLQIATENHQVTLRIVTEFPLVKDMIESNLHQLKADLQQQGLEIDELDVSVAHDAGQFGGNGNKTANDKTQPFSENGSLSENTLAEEEVDSRHPSLNLDPETGIDYFV